MSRQPSQQGIVDPRIQPPHAREFGIFLDELDGALCALAVFEQNTDIHPLVAHQIRHIAKDSIGQHLSFIIHSVIPLAILFVIPFVIHFQRLP